MAVNAKSSSFSLRLPHELREKLEAKARDENRSLGNFVTHVLSRALDKSGPPQNQTLNEESAHYEINSQNETEQNT